MQPLTILNDLHIGAQRAAGTTPLTAWQLRQYLLEEFERLVVACDGPLLILGDLFDTGHIPMADLLRVWQALSNHLEQGYELILVAGNHDYEKTLTTLSSFQFLCKLLQTQHKQMLQVIDEPTEVPRWNMHVIPHLPNQDLFDVALQNAPECEHLLVHCNYDNKFAVQADHSLNMSMDQAMRAKCKHVIFAHEHQQKNALGGKVVIIGNQFPSSVADCLGNDSKRLLLLTGPDLYLVETWSREGNYAEQDWRALKDDGCKFIRVVGEASAAEAADVVSAISKFRNKAKALVITNAVKIEGTADGEQIQITLEQVKSFDVLSALLECLDEREQGVVKGLLANRETA
jgi:metallophosphoesterase superfamily enzyme